MTTIANGFKALRRAGLVARQRFLCCASCAHSQLCVEHGRDKRHRDRAGYAFFHRQDAEHFEKTGIVHVRYGVFPKRRESTKAERKRATALGELIAKTLREAGLNVRWSGDPDTTILAFGAEKRRKVLRYLRSAA